MESQGEYAGYESPTLGFPYRAKPPTGVVSAELPAVRVHPEESLADGDKAGNVQHPHRIKVLQLQTPLIEEPA